jgi:flagella basal body P-ring formation protein FlgA
MRPFFSLLLLLTVIPCIAAPTVTLPERASVPGAQIVLGEIAEVQGTDDEMARLRQIVLAPAPIPGQRFLLTPGMVRVKLRQFGFNPEALTLTCPAAVEITRQTLTISGTRLVEAAEHWLRTSLMPAKGDELVLTPLATPADLPALTGTLTVVCAASGSTAGPQRTVQVAASVGGTVAWRGSITFRVQRFATVLVMTRALAAQQPFDPRMVELRRCDTTAVAGTPLTETALLAHARATQALRPGDVVTTAGIEPIPVVLRNQMVTVLAHCGEMVVRLRAVAVQDGGLGQVITVRNPQTRQEFSARVTAAGEVELCE